MLSFEFLTQTGGSKCSACWPSCTIPFPSVPESLVAPGGPNLLTPEQICMHSLSDGAPGLSHGASYN